MNNEGPFGQREHGQGGAGGRVVLHGLFARLVRWPLTLAFWVCAAGTVFAFTCPAMLERTDTLSVLVSHAASMARTFGLQLGVACVVLAVVLLVAGLRRLSLGAVILMLVWLGPEGWKLVRPIGELKGAGQETLTVLSMNVCYGRSSVEAVEREAAACGGVGADVVLFQEYTPAFGHALGGAMREYPYRVEVAREDAFGEAVYSKRPFVGEVELYPAGAGAGVGGRPQITVGVRFDGGVVRLTNVHLMSPASVGRVIEQRREALALADEVRRSAADKDDAGVRVERIVAGDFNGTVEGSIVKAVAAGGLEDAWVEGTRGLGGTWCAIGWYGYFGYIRIDNQLRSAGLVCTEAGVGGFTGSDHYPTWARYVRRR